jgi:hypothetical protein
MNIPKYIEDTRSLWRRSEIRSRAGLAALIALMSVLWYLILRDPRPPSPFVAIIMVSPMGMYLCFLIVNRKLYGRQLHESIDKALDESDPRLLALVLDSPSDSWSGRGNVIRRYLMAEMVGSPAQLVEVLTPARRRRLIRQIEVVYRNSHDEEALRFIRALVPLLVAAGDSSDLRYLRWIGKDRCVSEQQKAVRRMILDNLADKDARPDLRRAASSPVDIDLLHTLDESVTGNESELLRAGERDQAQPSDVGGGGSRGA